ncbi:MAG: NAD(P)/FAD-dependent oxidoreductase [Thermoleophilia bacterium]|nr:NAD(P)/FAD-dependent oxidoreductase [Thermoleophilia bacterium]
MNDTTSVHNRIAIVGTGFSGIAAAVKLLEEGEDDFVLYERSGDVGGTWRDNTYPGCACDIPSHLYSFSFAPNPGWSRAFSPQPEIQAYLKRVAHDHGVTAKVRFHHSLNEAAWDDEAGIWRLDTSQGPRTADVFISAVGGLSEPSTPNLPGLESFEGPTFHSATWNHDVDLAGKQVAVVGTGASAIQFVPEIQPEVARLDLYQRTPPWIMPRRDRPVSRLERRFFKAFPAAQKLVRTAIYWGRELFVLPMRRPRLARRTEDIARRHMHHQVEDPALREALTPDYSIGCKRIIQANSYYPALVRENVDVITSGISEVRSDRVISADGAEHPADVIIFGTGFKVSDMPIGHRIRGRNGQTLHEGWKGSPNAHNGTTVAGFPNFFMLMGPGTGLGHTSVTIMIEAQVDYVTQALRLLGGSDTVEPTEAAMTAWRDEVDRLSTGTVWTSGGCQSWYLDETGRNSTLWPTYATKFRRRLAKFDPAEHRFEGRSGDPVAEAGQRRPGYRSGAVRVAGPGDPGEGGEGHPDRDRGGQAADPDRC